MKKEWNLVLICFIGLFFIGLVSSDWVGQSTETNNGGKFCEFSVNYAAWMNVSPTGVKTLDVVIYNSSGNQQGNCSWEDIGCCPEGYSCSGSTGNCVKVDQCPQYKNRTSCIESNEVLDQKTPAYYFYQDHLNLKFYNQSIFEAKCIVWAEGETYTDKDGKLCQDFSRCECVWDGDSCQSSWNDGVSCPNGGPGITKGVICITKTSGEPKNLCDSVGKIIQNYTAIAYNGTVDPKNILSNPGSHGCTASPTEYSCSSVQVVPFFNLTNLLLTFLGTGLIYLFVKKR